MSRPKNTIADQLTAAQLAISNTQSDPVIQSMVKNYGYTAEKLSAGKALYDAALAAVNAQKAASGEQQMATRELDLVKTTANDAYQALAKVARAIFANDNSRLVALGLTGPTPKDTAGFIRKAYTLFDNARQVTDLAEYGYDASRLESERAKVTAYEQANNRQEAAKGSAQQATRDQETAIGYLNDWTAQYIKVARVALRGKKQLLEKIGVLAKTTRATHKPPTPAEIEKKA